MRNVFLILFTPFFALILTAVPDVRSEEKIIYSVSDGSPIAKGTIYTVDTTGTGAKKLFDFSGHPKDQSGLMDDLRSNGQKIYFTSDHSMVYGPARFNIFAISSTGSSLDQVTPGENSGIWGSGSGMVTGTVKRSNGNPYIGVPVFLEGNGLVYTDTNGAFSFASVSPGLFWLNGYRGGGSDTHHSQYIQIADGLSSGPWHLIPNTGDRWSHDSPIPSGDKIYYIYSYYSNLAIKYTDINGTIPHATVLNSNVTACGGEWDAFDVGKKTSKLLLLKYEPGCGGVYTANMDGSNFQQLIDMAAWGNVSELPGSQREIYWNSDETFFALRTSLQDQASAVYDGMLVFDASGVLQGQAYAGSNEKLRLHGWSPDGSWLLYSIYVSDPAMKVLNKIEISATGGIDISNIVALVNGAYITSATWVDVAIKNRSIWPTIDYLLDR